MSFENPSTSAVGNSTAGSHQRTRIEMVRPFPAGVTEISLAIYSLVPIPSGDKSHNEAVLQFPVRLFRDSDGPGRANPEEESAILTDFLSVALFTHARVGASTPTGLEHAIGDRRKTTHFPDLQVPFQSSELQDLFHRVVRLPEPLAKQFFRSCRTFNLALSFFGIDTTLACLLLVISGECLSNQNDVVPFSELDPSQKKAERFARFVINWADRSAFGTVDPTSPLAIEILKTAYFDNRSAFVHGGKEVSHAVDMADNLGRAYVRHSDSGTDRCSPGLRWLSTVLRSAACGLLLRGPLLPDADADLIGKLARGRGTIRLRAKRAIGAGEVTQVDKDFHLD